MTRLLTIVDALPVRIPERSRLLTALGLLDSDSWLRVEVRMDGDPREVLRPAAEWATPQDLANLLEIADTIAQCYDHGSVGTEHLALALVVSARLESDRRAELLELVSEAFGLGTLEDIESIPGIHLRRRDSNDSMHADDAAQLMMTLAEPWWTMKRLAPFLHPVLRLALFIVLIVLAVRSGNVGAWLIAFAAAVPFRDPRLVDWPDFPRYPRGIPWRVPSLLILSGIAALLSLPDIAIVLFASHVLFEGVGILLDRIPYRHLIAEGSALDGIQGHRRMIGVALGQIYRGSFRNRLLKWLLPLVPVAWVVLRWQDTLFIPTLRMVVERLPAGVVDAEPERVLRAVLEQTVLACVLFSVVLLLSASGHFVLAVLAAVSLSLLRGWPPIVPALVVILGALIFVFDWFAWRRIPSARFPVRFFVPRHRPISGLLAQIEARRRLRRGRPIAALNDYERWMSSLSPAQRAAAGRPRMVLAHLLLEAGRPGEAWDLRSSFPAGADVFRGYVVTRTLFLLNRLQDAQQAAYAVGRRMGESPLRVPKALRIVVALTMMEVLTQAVPEDGVGLTVLARIPDMATGGRVHEPVRMLRYAAAAFAPTRPVLAERCALGAAGLAILANNERATRRERDRESTLNVEGASAACQATRYLFGNGDATVESYSTWRTSTEVLFRDASPVEVAYELRAMAGLLDGVPGFAAAAYRTRLDVVGVLNTVRHELRTREDRLAWWQTFREVLDGAIEDAFTGKDWTTLAELIEYGRLQSEATQNPDAALGKPLFVRASGRSVLQDGHWEKAGQLAPAYELEEAAAVAGGPLTWWWSTWQSGDHMYWALVRPGAPDTGGRTAMSELAQPLASLRDAAPIELPGEPPALRRQRLRDSPLVNGPISRERELAGELAVLLPPALRTAVMDAPMEISLAISPDVALSHVPWASIRIDDADTRLIERARLTIAPPVAVLAEIASRARDSGDDAGPAPIRAAVLDPGGDLAGAARLAGDLGSDVAILAAADEPTAADVSRILAQVPPDSTWLFAGHTTSVPPEGRAGLSLRARGEYDPPFAIPGDALPAMPRAVILLACDSGDLRNATAGEWSTLGPAMLRAGADQVVATAFPIRDASSTDRELVARVPHLPLGEALHRVQLAQLDVWRTTRGRQSAPVDWAGHMVIGATAPAHPLTGHYGPSRVWVATTAFRLLDQAAQVAVRRGAVEVRIQDVRAAVFDWGWESLGRTTDLLLRVSARLLWRRGRAAEGTESSLPLAPEVKELLREAVQLSQALHHRVVSEDHVIAACLAREDAAARFARLVTGLDPRSIDGAAFMTERSIAGWHTTGIPRLEVLSVDAAVELARIAGAEPVAEERWHDSDR